MAFTEVSTGQIIQASHINQLADAWQGVSGGGVALQCIQLSSASNYAGDFRNLDSNSLALRARDANSNQLFLAVDAGCTLNKTTTLSRGEITTDLKMLDGTATWNSGGVTFTGWKLNVTDTASAAASLLLDLQVGGSSKFTVGKSGTITTALGTITTDIQNLSATATWNAGGVTFTALKANISDSASAAASLLMDLQVGGTSIFNVGKGGKTFIGDTANANMTVGLTINQAANDDEAIALKSSDVAHGMTTLAETDTFATLAKVNADNGGLKLTGYGDTNYALALDGLTVTEDTTKTTAGVAAIIMAAKTKSGTTAGDAGANANLVAIRNNLTTRFLFDAEGSAHGDVEWTTYDSHDDLALLNKLDAAMTRDPIKTEFGKYLSDYRQELQDAKVVNFYDDGPRAMVNFTRLAMLHTGALRQLGQRLQIAEQRLAALPGGN